MYYEIENSTSEDIQITLSGVTEAKLINIPANRIIVVEKKEELYFIDKTGKLIIRQIP